MNKKTLIQTVILALAIAAPGILSADAVKPAMGKTKSHMHAKKEQSRHSKKKADTPVSNPAATTAPATTPPSQTPK